MIKQISRALHDQRYINSCIKSHNRVVHATAKGGLYLKGDFTIEEMEDLIKRFKDGVDGAQAEWDFHSKEQA